MEIQVDLQTSTINDAIGRAVVESRLGVAIKERIEAFLKEGYTYGQKSLSDVIKTAVDMEMQKIIMQFVHNEFSEQITAKVRELLTDAVVSEVATNAFKRLYEKSTY